MLRTNTKFPETGYDTKLTSCRHYKLKKEINHYIFWRYTYFCQIDILLVTDLWLMHITVIRKKRLCRRQHDDKMVFHRQKDPPDILQRVFGWAAALWMYVLDLAHLVRHKPAEDTDDRRQAACPTALFSAAGRRYVRHLFASFCSRPCLSDRGPVLMRVSQLWYTAARGDQGLFLDEGKKLFSDRKFFAGSPVL